MASGIVEPIRERTPAVFTWQAARWLACCGDAAIYVGVLNEAGEREVYLFRCSHCGDYSTFRDEP